MRFPTPRKSDMLSIFFHTRENMKITVMGHTVLKKERPPLHLANWKREEQQLTLIRRDGAVCSEWNTSVLLTAYLHEYTTLLQFSVGKSFVKEINTFIQ